MVLIDGLHSLHFQVESFEFTGFHGIMMLSLVEVKLACDMHKTMADQRQLVCQNVRQLSEQQERPFLHPRFHAQFSRTTSASAASSFLDYICSKDLKWSEFPWSTWLKITAACATC